MPRKEWDLIIARMRSTTKFLLYSDDYYKEMKKRNDTHNKQLNLTPYDDAYKSPSSINQDISYEKYSKDKKNKQRQENIKLAKKTIIDIVDRFNVFVDKQIAYWAKETKWHKTINFQVFAKSMTILII